MAFIIALDLGTTFVKAISINKDLEVQNEVIIRTSTSNPRPGYQEQDPDEILNITEAALSELLMKHPKSDLMALVFSNAMHSIFPVDSTGKPLYNAMIWSDLRAGDIVERIPKNIEVSHLYRDSGTPIHPMAPLFKIRWLNENENNLFSESWKFISLKEYILSKWFGEYITDFSTASATGMFNIRSLTWNEQALTFAGISKDSLPQLTNVYCNVNNGKGELEKRFDLTPGIPVIIGATDGCLAVLGSGHSNLKELSLSIGTSAAIRTFSPKPIEDPQGRIFNYYLDRDTYITGGPSNNGGNLLEWFENKFISECQMLNPDYWSSVINSVPSCSEGVFFLPYIFGERAPIWKSKISASFLGIDHRHGTEHLAKSVLEGMIMNTRVISEFIDSDQLINNIIISGGAFNIPGLAQLTADIYGRTVISLKTSHLSARGAGILGWRSLGIQANDMNIDSIRFYPDEKHKIVYSEHFRKFKDLLTIYQLETDL